MLYHTNIKHKRDGWIYQYWRQISGGAVLIKTKGNFYDYKNY